MFAISLTELDNAVSGWRVEGGFYALTCTFEGEFYFLVD